MLQMPQPEERVISESLNIDRITKYTAFLKMGIKKLKLEKITNLVAASSVLELTRFESMTATEEIVDLTSFNIVRQTRDKESVYRPRFVGELWQLRRKMMWMIMRLIDVERIVRLVIRHFFLWPAAKLTVAISAGEES